VAFKDEPAAETQVLSIRRITMLVILDSSKVPLHRFQSHVGSLNPRLLKSTAGIHHNPFHSHSMGSLCF